KTFEYKKVPTPEHIIEKQLYNLADRLEKVEVDEKEIEKYLPGVRKKLEWLSEEDLLKRVLSLEFNRLLDYYRNMPDIDLNADGKDRREREKGERRKGDARKNKDRRTAENGYERLMVDIGKASGFFPGNLMDLINKNVPGSKPEIGRIDLLPDYTLFDVRKGDGRRVLEALRHAEFYGQPVNCEIATDRDYSADARKKGKGKRRLSKDKGSKDRKGRGSRKSYGGDPFELENTAKKIRKEKKAKKEKKKEEKPKYNGNYDIFIKK
ncbi:MAG: DbpA RNA binding domain-containing protein, partial [Muribaculaceae bacterium]|nr:DbpA RNA binding domain-containing protein [Muribaculaceae bacterium]